MVVRGQARELLLDAAEASILALGLSATTVDEVCRAAGVTKGAFYHHFDTKDALARAALERYFQRIASAFAVESKADDPCARLHEILTHAERVVGSSLLAEGCLMAVYALELAESDDDLRREVALRFDRLAEGIEPAITAALRHRGAKPKAARRDGAFLARQFVSCLEGGIVLAKAHRDPKRIVEAFRFYRGSLEARIA